MRLPLLSVLLLPFLHAGAAHAADRTIGVFVALADNKSQGIVPVPAKIGNGDDPENNLYWGNSEGLKGYFDHSPRWKLIARSDAPSGDILRTRTYRHRNRALTLIARAYRGSAIKTCLADFQAAVRARSCDLAVFIGHNGLMDFTLPPPARPTVQRKPADCAVLCCKSESYFRTRLAEAGGHPVLLTAQLMYPGAFILGAICEPWLDGKSPATLRQCAGRAYAANQRISQEAGIGIFASLTP